MKTQNKSQQVVSTKKINRDFDTEVIKDSMMLTGFVTITNDELRSLLYDVPSKTSVAIYIILLSHRNSETGLCCPTIDVLARECNCNVKSVRKAIDDLEQAGYLIIQSGSQHKANHYFMPKSKNTHGELFLPSKIDSRQGYIDEMSSATRFKKLTNKISQ